MIPGGLTPLLQPLDTNINSMFKGLLEQEIHGFVSCWEENNQGKWVVKEKRIMVTQVVASCCQRLQGDKRDIVIESFTDTGISISPDGSEDNLIHIKDIDRATIDWNDWENARDITIKLEEEYEEVPADLGHHFGFELGGESLIAAGHYMLMKNEDLRNLCKARKLKMGGNKGELQERLKANDLAQNTV